MRYKVLALVTVAVVTLIALFYRGDEVANEANATVFTVLQEPAVVDAQSVLPQCIFPARNNSTEEVVNVLGSCEDANGLHVGDKAYAVQISLGQEAWVLQRTWERTVGSS